MALKERLEALATAIGTRIKAIETKQNGITHRTRTQAQWDAEGAHPANTVTYIVG